MLWRLRRWKISIPGGSQAGNWWLPRRIIFNEARKEVVETIQFKLQYHKDKERAEQVKQIKGW